MLGPGLINALLAIAIIEIPIYARVVQTAYPIHQRGKIMSLIKVGMAASMLIATPIAGRLLDTSGYQVLFPLAAIAGVEETEAAYSADRRAHR